MKQSFSFMRMYAITPCHAGSGAALGPVDLPIERERHTNWPVINASGMKGAMRAHFDRFKDRIPSEDYKDKDKQCKQLTELVFGSEKSEYAGAMTISDAKILAFPMRSDVAPFVWITCPAVLRRLNKDFNFCGKQEEDISTLEEITEEKALAAAGSFDKNQKVLLEDMEVEILNKINIENFKVFFDDVDKLLIVSDSVFKYGVAQCTAINAQIKIDQATGTTTERSLRYQEELPTDTVMYAVVGWGDSREKQGEAGCLKETIIKKYVEKNVLNSHLQVGGDETLGRGIFAIDWIEGGKSNAD